MENPPKKIATEAASTINPTMYKTVNVGGLNSFYRHTARKNAQTILLFLRGFPTSSQMIRCLITQLSDKFHPLALDYPGFGNSNQPSMKSIFTPLFEYQSNVPHILKLAGIFSQTSTSDAYCLGENDYIFPEEGVHPYK
jgi:pimeloyl-ACP methyl ester carboxylesterase